MIRQFLRITWGSGFTVTDLGGGHIYVTAGAGGGVTSFAKDGDPALTGDVTISEGEGIVLTEAGQNIEIAVAIDGGGA